MYDEGVGVTAISSISKKSRLKILNTVIHPLIPPLILWAIYRYPVGGQNFDMGEPTSYSFIKKKDLTLIGKYDSAIINS